MTKRLTFKRYLSPNIVQGQGVYLLSESRQVALHGALSERLAPLLDSTRTRSEIVDALADDFAEEFVQKGLDRLITAGLVVEDELGADTRQSAFWELLGLSAPAARAAVQGRPVSVRAVGSADTSQVVSAASSLGIRVIEDERDSELTIVVTDDLLHPDLAEINDKALANDQPWLLIQPLGETSAVSPVFEPAATPCWQCLASRVKGNRLVSSFVQASTESSRLPVTALADLPVTVDLAARMAMLRVAMWLAGVKPEGFDVVTFDALHLKTREHRLDRRPQCPACGDPALQAELARRPVVLESRAKASTRDGGHRAKNPSDMLAEFGRLVSPVTGVVSALVRQDTGTELHAYLAGHNFALHGNSLSGLRSGLRSQSSGKGMSDEQARASALGEAIERYSGVFQGDEARISSSYRELGPDQAIHPDALQQYSSRQILEREEWNARGSTFHFVVQGFDEDAVIEWTPVWSLTAGRHKYVPTASLYYRYPQPAGQTFLTANSNGCAAGVSIEDAALQGFMELVERDSVALWWYNRVQRPAIDLGSFDEPYFAHWQRVYESFRRETWVLDLTSDLGIPVAAAVSRRTDKPAEDILLAFGAHFDMRIAISRALSEMNQFVSAVLPVGDGSGSYAFDDPDQVRWWRTATAENQPYLRPLPGARPRTAADHPAPFSEDLRKDLLTAQRIVEDAGLEMLLLDQTRPDIGLPVVKVIVPGLRHFWPRYAAGRLYDAPVRLGWLTEPTREEDLNPIGMFL